MKNKPIVSIIMNCFNGEKFLSQSLKSLKEQNFKNWELIFFDNCSTDESKKILLSYKDRRFKYFKSKKFLTLYAARNLAIKKSKGRYICFLDVDDWWHKDKLKLQINLLLKNKRIKFVYTNYYLYFEKNKKSKILFNDKLPEGFITQELLNNYCIGILTVMIRKEIFLKNKFDKSYNIIGDFDLFLRLSKKYEIKSIQKPLSYYRNHNENLSKKKNIYI